MHWATCLILLSAAVFAQEPAPKTLLQQASEAYRDATSLCDAGRFLEAEPVFQRALAAHRLLAEGNQSYIMAELHNLGVIARKRGDFVQSLDLLNQSLAISRKQNAIRASANTLIELANTYRAMDKPYDADPLVREAITLSEQIVPPDYQVYATACNTYGALHIRLQDVEGATRWFQRALDAARKLPSTQPELEASVMANLATSEFAGGHNDQSLELFRQAIAMQEKYLGPSHPKLAETLTSYSSVLRRLRFKQEAAKANRRAVQIRNSLVAPKPYIQ
ncbi:tetratricopeptide repeat protein [Paludibaculum fermentans]|uniref:Tetratricopeptide repeat protein n=1 Tax=Paludibaculum fermentans TaxID=1473598 RepID=A0A7S7NJZ0_PALFE|nr:tetratricopeptide repeat protein [Paludibaculum fermentans]QOY85021.1 tetratricopeptide repeat protein [Paludibaculum fermentans]